MIKLLAAGAIAGAALTACSPTPAAPPAETKTVATTKIVEATPPACTKALDLADQLFGYASDGFKAAADATRAALRGDNAAVTAATTRMNGITNTVQNLTPVYQAAERDCRRTAQSS